jgi:hypothetical protein
LRRNQWPEWIGITGRFASEYAFSLRTPFSSGLTGRDHPAPRYAAALARQAAKPVLGYGLDVWRGNKVLSLQWEDNGRAELISMKPGAWEAEVLTIA